MYVIVLPVSYEEKCRYNSCSKERTILFLLVLEDGIYSSLYVVYPKLHLCFPNFLLQFPIKYVEGKGFLSLFRNEREVVLTQYLVILILLAMFLLLFVLNDLADLEVEELYNIVQIFHLKEVRERESINTNNRYKEE